MYLTVSSIVLAIFIFFIILFLSYRNKIHRQNELLRALNQMSKVLLDPDMKDINENIVKAMCIMGEALKVDRVCMWKNHIKDGKLHCYLIHEWIGKDRPKLSGNFLKDLAYNEYLIGWEETLSNGNCINSLVKDLSASEQSQIKPQNALSIFVAPVFLHKNFWGLLGFDDCKKERKYTEYEGMSMRSAGRMIANAYIKNDMTSDLIESNSRLEEAVKEIDNANIIKNNSLKAMEKILNSIDAMIYVTDPVTNEILFMNDSMKQHYKLEGDCVGHLCYKILQKNLDQRCSFCPCYKLDLAPSSAIIWEEHSTLTNRIYRNVDRYINWPTRQNVHMQQSIDMTELVSAKEIAEESNKSKSAFLATMSHEIRTPMNAILGIAEIQLQEKNLSDSTAEAFNKIYESGDLLLNIINDILDLSKIDAGKLELNPVKYDIPSLINDTALLNRMRFESKSIELKLNLNENTPLYLFGDELRIKQILNNILSNSYKYTDEGKIEFSVFAEPSPEYGNEYRTIVFSIGDTGQGMTESQIEKIYDEYTRFNTASNRTTVGAGLGMSITKRLVNLMNGRISIRSEINKGSVFTVYIPQKIAGDEVCGLELSNKLSNLSYYNSSSIKKAYFLREYMPYGSVLIVDDVESNLYVAKGLLMPYGLKIDCASSGFGAIEKIKNGNVYDIIFMDYMMPKMDGIETTRLIREMGYNGTIVALTANALVGQADIFLHKGFDGFISKPIDSRELNFLLNDFIRNKKPNAVVEEARKEQREKDKSNNKINTEKTIKENVSISEMEEFFILDAQNAIGVLENIFSKKDNLSGADLDLYITTVHGLKSAFSNIGEKELSALSFKLEKAGFEKNIEIIKNDTLELINALKMLVEKLKQNEEIFEVEINNETYDYIKMKLLDIRGACKDFNINDAKTVLTELKTKKWPSSIKAVFDEISVHLLHSSFKKAVSIIDKFILELS